jgi:rhombotail lipoprotein
MTRLTLIAAPLMLLGLVLASSGCGEYHALVNPRINLSSSGLITDANQARRLEQRMTDRDVADLLDLRVQPRLPTSLAVAKLQGGSHGQFHLAEIDATEMEAWQKLIDGYPLVASVHPVSPLVVSNESCVSLQSLRLAAGKMGCELLLVYLQADSSANNYNDASVLYWTILGLWLAPGNTMEHKTVMQAILVDSRTGAIFGTAGGDSHLKRNCPAAFDDVRRKELADQAPAAALADLQKGFGRLMKQVVAASVAKKG